MTPPPRNTNNPTSAPILERATSSENNDAMQQQHDNGSVTVPGTGLSGIGGGLPPVSRGLPNTTTTPAPFGMSALSTLSAAAAAANTGPATTGGAASLAAGPTTTPTAAVGASLTDGTPTANGMMMNTNNLATYHGGYAGVPGYPVPYHPYGFPHFPPHAPPPTFQYAGYGGMTPMTPHAALTAPLPGDTGTTPDTLSHMDTTAVAITPTVKSQGDVKHPPYLDWKREFLNLQAMEKKSKGKVDHCQNQLSLLKVQAQSLKTQKVAHEEDVRSYENQRADMMRTILANPDQRKALMDGARAHGDLAFFQGMLNAAENTKAKDAALANSMQKQKEEDDKTLTQSSKPDMSSKRKKKDSSDDDDDDDDNKETSKPKPKEKKARKPAATKRKNEGPSDDGESSDQDDDDDDDEPIVEKVVTTSSGRASKRPKYLRN